MNPFFILSLMSRLFTCRHSRSLFGAPTLTVLGILLSFFVISGTQAAHAETGQKALILGSSVSGDALSAEATKAVSNGFTVNVVDDATWGAMTAAQFADYQLVIVGDPYCSSLPAVVSQNAEALADAVMARAGGNTQAGNRILIGTDPVFHSSQGGDKLIGAGIDFAGAKDGATNLYLDFSCDDPDFDANGIPDGQDKLLPLLTLDPTPGWTQNQSPPCGGSVSLISNADQFASLKSADLQGWGCSDHETFPTFPTDWSALAIATDTPTMPTCGTDVDTKATVCGEAYVLIAGSGIVSTAPNLSLDPATATNPVGTKHTVTAAVTNPDKTPRSGVVVSFLVTGANAGATGACVPADCTTDAAGKVSFTYTGANEGDDTINAAITVDGARQTATASKKWVASTTHTLTVTKSGSGSGSVTSSPAGIDCGGTCSAAFNDGTTVTLMATPASGSTFTGWGGACTGTGSCVVTMDQARAVTATFALTPPPPPPPAKHDPVCSGVSASPNVLTKPNHKFRLITLSGASDPDGDTLAYQITGVTQDEPVSGLGNGDKSPDAKTGPSGNKVYLRAERKGTGNGRVYVIAFTVSDGHGGSCSGTVTVSVPHDGHHKAVNSGATQDSFATGPALSVKKTQTLSRKLNYVLVKASCSAPCKAVKGTGKVKVGSKTIGKLTKVTKAVNGTSVSLKLKLPPKVLSKALKALAAHKKTKASFKVAALDASGKVLASSTGTVQFRRKFH